MSGLCAALLGLLPDIYSVALLLLISPLSPPPRLLRIPRPLKRVQWTQQKVARHVHHPHADLIIIAGMVASKRAVDIVNGIVWLLGSGRLGDSLVGLELLGQPSEDPGDPTQQHGVPPQLLVGAEPVLGSPKRGVVLCLPRRRLQRWLLAEGRAWKGRHGVGGDGSGSSGGGGGGGGSDELWSPWWVEDGIDAIPPRLPGRASGRGRRLAGRSGGGGGGSGGRGLVGVSRDTRADLPQQ